MLRAIATGVLAVTAMACGKHPPERRTDDPPAVGTPPSTPATVTTVPPVMTAESPATVAPASTPADPDWTPGRPAATTLPAGFSDLTKAVRIELMDEWNGFGPITHHLVARLERNGASFDVIAKVSASSNTFAETAPDPHSPRWKYASTCACALDAKCACERDALAKKGSAPAAAVEAFLATIARRTIDPKQDYRTGNVHTDDYPRGHAAVWMPGAADPVHVSFTDNQRHWRVNGAFVSLDPKTQHGDIDKAWDGMLKAMGSEPWIKEANKKRGQGHGR